MTLTLGHFLSLGAMLFALAVIGIFFESKKSDCSFDGHRANAAGCEYEFCGVLLLPG